jgi:hypothetical protein
MRKVSIGLIGSSQIRSIYEVIYTRYKTKIITKYIDEKNIVKKAISFIKDISDVTIIYQVFVPTSSKLIFICKLLGKKVVAHWIGTDVYNFTKDIYGYRYLSLIDKHLVCSAPLQRELAEKKLFADILPIIPFNMDFAPISMPLEHAVLLYVPKGREEFYGIDLIEKTINYFKNLIFYIVANDNRNVFYQNNVKVMGWLNTNEMEKLYHKISIVLRVPKHDGLSMLVIEALAKGKNVIYNYAHPYVNFVTTYDDIRIAIENILSKTPTINLEASNYINDTYNRKNFLNLFDKYISGV